MSGLDLSACEDLRHALAALEDQLRAAAHCYEMGGLEARRFAIHCAIQATMVFVMKVDPWRQAGLQKPFVALAGAFHAALDGSQDPLLTPRPPKGRPPDRIEKQMLKGMAAAAMTLRMESGEAKKDAAQHVARQLSRLGCRNVAWKKVAGWRDEVSGYGRDVAASTYRNWYEQGKTSDRPPLEAAGRILEAITVLSPEKNRINPPSFSDSI